MNNDLIKKLVKEEIKSIKRIHAGVSNTSFLVNNKYVVRLKEEKEHFYRVKHEQKILNKIASLKIADRLCHLDENGNKVSEYIPNTRIFTGKDEEIVAAANLLKKLHTSKIHSSIYFKPFKRYKYYQKHSGITAAFKHEEQVLKKVHHFYRHYHKVFCHNDVVDNNLLFTKNNSFLIDYEFAGMNIPLFDLASLISENNISDVKKVELFLKTYGANDDEITDLPYMIMFLNLLWYYWANERYLVTKKEIYHDIAETKKAHIDDDMRSLLIYK